MLSREDRILSELLVSRGLATPEKMEACARILEASPMGSSLAEVLVSSGELDADIARGAAEEARDLDRALAPVLPGTRTLGEFRLVREIGRGGMGIVYEAEQEPLGRRVALKVLPAGAALDERLALRFLREARAVARLHHPGIVPLYASGRAEGALYFAMELVEGKTLASRIASGPLGAEEAARIAAEVARALAHAHEAGLVHRDIKPENILLGADDRPRLTDFGLVHEAAALPLTLSHHVLGTPAYIAPEQAMGGAVDARADIYALGAVLHTMLSGHPPYAGEVPSAVLAKVLAGPPPPLGDQAPHVDPALAGICARAMSRRPEDRPASALALAEEIEAFLAGQRGDGPATTAPRAVSPRNTILLASAGLVLVAGVAWTLLARRHDTTSGPPEPREPEPAFSLVTRAAARVDSISLGSGGELIAYLVDQDNTTEGFLMRIGEGEPRSVDDMVGGKVEGVSFSPDGKRLALSLQPGRRIHVLDLADHQLTDLGAAGYRPAWTSDGGEILFTTRESRLSGASGDSQIWAVDVATGGKRLVKGMRAAFPHPSPRGRRLVFVSRAGSASSDLWTSTLLGEDASRITNDPDEDWSPVWAADGRVYFGSDRGGCSRLWRIRVDEDSGRPAGDPELAATTVLAAPFFLTVSGDGRRLALASTGEPGRVHSFPFDAERGALRDSPTATSRLALFHESADPSPDGRSLVFATTGPRSDLLVQELHTRGEARSITSSPGHNRAPRWSPDGRHIAFQSDRSGRMEVWLIRPDGTDLRQIAASPDGPSRSPVWSPDGTTLALTRESVGSVLVDLRGGGSPEIRLPPPPPGASFEPRDWSPDGKTLAGDAGGVVLYSLAEREYRRLTDFGWHPAWLPDGRRIVFASERGLHLLETLDGTTRLLYASGPARLSGVRLTRSGDTILATLSVSDREIYLADLAP